MSFNYHPSAIIDDGAIVGNGTRIWHWTHICATAQIGENCSLGQNVYIGPNVVIGDNVKIQNNVSVYEGVTLENDVFCGPSMVFTNVYNPRSSVERKTEFKKTLVKKGATLGANCTIVCGNEIGSNAFVGAGSVVNSSIKNNALVVGVPGKQIGWMTDYGHRIPLPNNGEGRYTCPETSTVYILKNEQLFKAR